MAGNREDILPKFDDFAKSTTVHGIAHVSQTSNTATRIVWIIICLVAFGMLCLMTFMNISQYFSYETAISIEEEPNGFVPPYVSFCNHRHLSMEVTENLVEMIEEYFRSNFSLTVLRDSASSLYSLKLFNIEDVLEFAESQRRLESIADRAVVFAQLSEEDINEITPSLDELVMSCRTADNECNLDYVISYVHSFFFKCYTYDPMEGRSLSESVTEGINLGQTFVFLSGSNMITKDAREIPGFNRYTEQTGGTDGLRLVIHPRGTVPDPLNDGVDVATGSSVVLGITMTTTQRLEHPFGNCTEQNKESIKLIKSLANGNETYEKILLAADELDNWNKTQKYTTSQCKKSCYQRHVWMNCECLDVNLPSPLSPSNNSVLCRFIDFDKTDLNTVNRCINNSESPVCKRILEKVPHNINCIHEVYNNYSNWRGECECHPACEESNYKVSYSMSTWPARGPQLTFAFREMTNIINAKKSSKFHKFIKYFNNPQNKKDILDNFARVTLYYQTPSVTKTLQVQKYSLVDILSNAGGLMGLWLGISVISLFEIVLFIVSIFTMVLKRNCSPENTVVSEFESN